MDHYCAPQWVDLSSSPQVPCDDYFEKFHDIYESKIDPNICKGNIKIRKKISEIIATPQESMQLQVKDFMKSTPNLNENYKTEIDYLKNTPIKVLHPLKHSNKKHEVLKEITYDNVLLEAMQNIQLGANLHELKKEVDLSSKENIFKKPMPIKNKISKPAQICELDKSCISILSNEEETKTKFSNVNMIKRNKDSSKKTTDTKENDTKSDKTNGTVKNDTLKMKIDNKNKNIKLKSSTTKQQTSVARASESTKKNTVNKFSTICKQKGKEESKYKVFENNHSKSTQLKHNSTNSAVSLKKATQKNSKVLNTVDTAKEKQISSFSFNEREKAFCQRKMPFNKIVSTVVGNTGSEIIIKKEKILFFDIPIHTRQKKVTCPVPFSFENRDKIKKQLKLDQESKNIKAQSVSNTKLVSDFNKAQKRINKCGNIAKKEGTSCIGNRMINEKHKGIKKPEQSEKLCVVFRKPNKIAQPMKTMNSLKDHNYDKNKNETGKQENKDKTEQKKNGNIPNKIFNNKEQNPLKSISNKNNCINKNSKIQAKETLHKNKYIQKENKKPNINLSTRAKNVLNQDKGIKPKSTTVKPIADDREKKREFEERMRQRKIMHEEKLKREREAKLAKEKLEIAKLRQQAEIKAKPMPVYKPVIHIKSVKALTQPHSPVWCSKHKVSRIKETS